MVNTNTPMYPAKAKMYIVEWVNSIAQDQFEINDNRAQYILKTYRSSSFCIQLIQHEEQIFIQILKSVDFDNKICEEELTSFPIPNDLQSTCALLSHFIDGVPLDFNMTVWASAKQEEE